MGEAVAPGGALSAGADGHVYGSSTLHTQLEPGDHLVAMMILIKPDFDT